MSTGNILEEELMEDDDGRGNVPDDGDQELAGNNLCARLPAQVSAPAELPECPKKHEYN